jgi:hypothetical protein
MPDPAPATQEAQPSVESSAELCRRHGWVAGDLLCCGVEVPPDRPKFVRITAVGETQVLGHHVQSDCSQGPETILELLPLAWRKLSLREWQSLQDTA